MAPSPMPTLLLLLLPALRYLLVAWIVGSVCFSGAEALRQPSPSSVKYSMVVVFGRPGSGKTTVANAALEMLSSPLPLPLPLPSTAHPHKAVMGLDLDVCVTQAMRDNFGKGIYPTLEERRVFAIDACEYVDRQVAEVEALCREKDDDDDDDDDEAMGLCAVISFSFVNTDLRDIFRERFPSAEWILIDTTEEDCAKRIREREGHFYKGKVVPGEDEDEDSGDGSGEDDPTATTNNEADNNSDWKFAPVDFPHLVLGGSDSVEDNAKKIVEKITNDAQQQRQR